MRKVEGRRIIGILKKTGDYVVETAEGRFAEEKYVASTDGFKNEIKPFTAHRRLKPQEKVVYAERRPASD